MAEALKVSVIIPTYNGAHKVVNALHSLEQQTYKAAEVIVVIDGSTDGTRQVIESGQFQLGKLKIVEQQNGGRAKVRNKGAEEADGEILLFMDDDMVAPPEWIAMHAAHHINFPGTLLTGRLEDPNADSNNDFLKFKAWLNTRWNKGMTIKAGSSLLEIPYITANNFSVSKSIFSLLGGFDGRLKDAEDYDLAVRTQKTGYKIYLSNDAFAWHNDVTTCRNYIKRLRQYTEAQRFLVNLKPEIYADNHRYKVGVPTGIKGLLFKSVCNQFFWQAVDKGYFKFLPASVRYKLYDVIVTANGTFFPERAAL